MYQALYRKYRPKTFDDVMGQDIVIKILKNSIINETVSHAYLFNGPRGTGKTSVAKIFAKILNCHNLEKLIPCNECVSCSQVNNSQNIDIIEIDAASNNGVDEIREIRNKITLVPSNSKYKIYIVDEVHMLTTQAFNALLKTLEEPPKHIIFIFATTEPHKIPKTILSRCQKFDFKKITGDNITERLKYICKEEKIEITEEALNEIALLSDGGMRDSISLLDQLVAFSMKKITVDDVHTISGTLTSLELQEFVMNLLNNELEKILIKIEEYDRSGKNIEKILKEIIDVLKNAAIYAKAPSLITTNIDFYNKIKELNCNNKIYNYIISFSKLSSELKKFNNSKLLFEIEIIKNLDEQKIQNNELTVFENKNNNLLKQCAKVGFDNENNTPNLLNNNEFKTIRINNSLSAFSQKERETVKKELKLLDDFLLDEKYSKIISIIKDGELKSTGNNYLVFVYKTKLLADTFNDKISEIEKTLSTIIKKNFKVISVDYDEWNYIKNDYNQNKKKYVFKQELNSNDKKTNIKMEKNNIDLMFNDIIEVDN